MALVLQSLLAVFVKWCSVQPAQLMNHQLPSKKVRIYLSPQCRIPSKQPWHGLQDCYRELESIELFAALAQQEAFERLSQMWEVDTSRVAFFEFHPLSKAHGSNSEPGILSRSCRYLILGEWDDNKPRLKEAQLQMEIKHDAPWLQEAELAKLNTKRL